MSNLPPGLISAVRDQSAILFLGAGATKGAVHPTGKQAPSSNQIRDQLSDKFLNGKLKDKTLNQVAELCISETDLFKVQTYIRDIFIDFSPADFHRLITQYFWHAIVTTNFDLIVERAYADPSGRKQEIVPFTKNGQRDEALAGIEQAVRILAQSVAPDGTQLADERESLLWGFVNTLHAQTQRIDRAVDKIVPEMRDLQRAQDGSEISAHELETLTGRAQNLGDRRDAFEKMRDLAAEGYRVETGEAWRPRHGSHTSRTGVLTSAAIDARDFVRARKDRETQAHLPQGTLIAFAGGKDACDTTVIWNELDKAKAKYDDMVLAHGGGPGAERIAAKWAENRNVDQIVCRPDWNRHGKAAPFRRNDDLLNLIPKGIIAFPGSGITENLIDKARQKGFPVYRVAA